LPSYRRTKDVQVSYIGTDRMGSQGVMWGQLLPREGKVTRGIMGSLVSLLEPFFFFCKWWQMILCHACFSFTSINLLVLFLLFGVLFMLYSSCLSFSFACIFFNLVFFFFNNPTIYIYKYIYIYNHASLIVYRKI
jgi:hypothetical protein